MPQQTCNYCGQLVRSGSDWFTANCPAPMIPPRGHWVDYPGCLDWPTIPAWAPKLEESHADS